MEIPLQIDEQKQVQARRYARLRRRLWLLETVFGVLYNLLWLFGGFSLSWRRWLEGALDAYGLRNEWILVALFAFGFGGLYFLFTRPFAFYGEYILPHRFGLSTQTRKGWLGDQAKGLLVGVPLGLLVLELLYAALRWTGDQWWLWAGSGMVIFTVLMANLAPVLIMPLFNKFVPLGEEYAELEQRLLELARRSGTRVRGVFAFDMSRRTRAANAALTGIGNTRRIVLGDTLLKEFTPDEVETVLAHELGHHVHRDIPLIILVQSVLMFGGFYIASLALRWGVRALGFASIADIASLPFFLLVMEFFGLVIQPLGNAFSRWRERLADDYAVRLTQKGAAFASALTRLANQNLSEVDPEKWVIFFFYDHPPLKERIERALALARSS